MRWMAGVMEVQGLHVRNVCLTNQKGIQSHLKDRIPDKLTGSFNLTGFNSSLLFLSQFYCGKEVWTFSCLSLLWCTGVPRGKHFPRAAAHLHGIQVNIVYDLGHHFTAAFWNEFPNQIYYQQVTRVPFTIQCLIRKQESEGNSLSQNSLSWSELRGYTATLR